MSQRSIYASANLALTSFVERRSAEADGDRALTKTGVELHRALLKVCPKISHDWYLRKFREGVQLWHGQVHVVFIVEMTASKCTRTGEATESARGNPG